jgi:hypothetical protein
MGRGARIAGSSTTERDATLLSYHIARLMYQEREREIRQRLRFRAGWEEPRRKPSLPLRRRLGYGLIRLGRALAYDGPLQLSARQ